VGARWRRRRRRSARRSHRAAPRVRSHCRFRQRGTECVRESAMKWMSAGDKATEPHAAPGAAGGPRGRAARSPRTPPRTRRTCGARRPRRLAFHHCGSLPPMADPPHRPRPPAPGRNRSSQPGGSSA
jgi:hypothetical protein